MPTKVKATQSADSQEAPREMIGITHLTVGLGSQHYGGGNGGTQL